MSPLKSSLARSAKKLIKVFNQSDLSLRGATQKDKRKLPPATWATADIEVRATYTYTGPVTLPGAQIKSDAGTP